MTQILQSELAGTACYRYTKKMRTLTKHIICKLLLLQVGHLCLPLPDCHPITILYALKTSSKRLFPDITDIVEVHPFNLLGKLYVAPRAQEGISSDSLLPLFFLTPWEHQYTQRASPLQVPFDTAIPKNDYSNSSIIFWSPRVV